MKLFAVLAGLIVVLVGCSAPTPVIETTVNSRADYADLMIRCLAEDGIEATEQGTGLVVERSGGQSDAVTNAVSKCEHELGYDTIDRLSDDQLGELYELERETYECLVALEFDVSLPSKQVYVDHYYSGKFPLLETQVLEQSDSVETYESALTSCPAAVGVYDPYE